MIRILSSLVKYSGHELFLFFLCQWQIGNMSNMNCKIIKLIKIYRTGDNMAKKLWRCSSSLLEGWERRYITSIERCMAVYHDWRKNINGPATFMRHCHNVKRIFQHIFQVIAKRWQPTWNGVTKLYVTSWWWTWEFTK